MAFKELLEQLSKLMHAGAAAGRGGVILVGVDRASALRDRLGFTGLIQLRQGMRDAAMATLANLDHVLPFGWSSQLLLLPDQPADALDQCAQQLFAALTERTYPAGDDEIALSVSLAYARFDHRFRQVDELLLALVQQLDAIENAGGNALAAVKPGISARKALSSGDHMLGLLMEALRTGSLRVVFQPLLATSGRERIRSYQMLPRLEAEDGKLIAAAEFLPQARAAALLPVLDRWMAVHAFRLLRGPLADRSVRLFVNQSEALLAEADRRRWLARHLAAEPGLGERIVVEIPLHDAMAHLRGAAELLEMAREHGLGVCFSRVDERSRWPLLAGELNSGFVRMAPDFAARLGREGRLERRFMEVSGPARSRGVRIIMPMIEDSRTAASMWRSGADFMQGNMIQAPEDTIAELEVSESR